MRQGPQNGFRLCLVLGSYRLSSASKDDGSEEDEIDRLEKAIPQGHAETVILGEEQEMSGKSIDMKVEDDKRI